MKVCSKCGAKLNDEAYICPNCGEEFIRGKTYSSGIYECTGVNTAVSISQGHSSTDSKVMLIFSYISFFIIIPLLNSKDKDSNFAKFHINQGFALFISEILYAIACYILNAVLMEISEWLYPVVAVMVAGSIVFIVFSFLGIVSVMKEEKRELPLIGQFKFLK